MTRYNYNYINYNLQPHRNRTAKSDNAKF